MSAPPFPLLYTDEALRVLDDLAKPGYATNLKKVKKTLRLLRDVGPSHPGLISHEYQSLSGPAGEEVWESYVENRAPGAWRLWWMYGPTPDALTILTIGPHPYQSRRPTASPTGARGYRRRLTPQADPAMRQVDHS